MTRNEFNEIIDFVLKNVDKYQIILANIEIRAFPRNQGEYLCWYGTFCFYEDETKQHYKNFACGNDFEKPNLEEIKANFLNFCKNFYRPRCEKCGQYLDC